VETRQSFIVRNIRSPIPLNLNPFPIGEEMEQEKKELIEKLLARAEKEEQLGNIGFADRLVEMAIKHEATIMNGNHAGLENS
jgi:hypothetical protein